MNKLFDVDTMVTMSAKKSYKLAQKICDDSVEDSITEYGMEQLAKEWYNAKKEFIKMMNGNTSVEVETENDFDEQEINTMLHNYVQKIEIGNFVYKREKYQLQQLNIEKLNSYATYYLKCFMNSSMAVHTVGNNKITEEILIEGYFRLLCKELKINTDKIRGMKFTKFFIMMLKSFLECGKFEDDTVGKLEIEIISQDFSRLMNTIKTTKKKQTVVLSCALEDFVSMSNGNGWHSCHNLGSDYGQGCIAYAMSPNVLIAYVKNEYGEYLKSWRQVVYCDSETGFAIGSRQYPSINESASKEARNLWQKLYNKFHNGVETTDDFVFSKKSDGLAKYLDTDNDFAYVDIIHLGEHDSRISGHVWSTWTKENGKNSMNVCGEEIICLECGWLHSDSERDSVTCDSCSGNKHYCEHCEEHFSEDDGEWVESANGYVCHECIENHYEWCNYCDEYHRSDEVGYVESVSDYVCDNCLDKYFGYCDDCDEYFPLEDIIEVNSGKGGEEKYVCCDCVRDYLYCDDCDEYFTEENVTTVNNGEITVCNDCLNDTDYYVCQNCDEYFTSSYMAEDNDFCEDCCEDIKG